MSTALHSTAPTHEDFVTSVSNKDFVLKLRDIVAPLHNEINVGMVEPLNVVGLGVCVVQMDGQSTCLFTDSSEKPVNPGIRMAAAILATCLQSEDSSRVKSLLYKAQKLTEQALKIRTGEIISSTLH